MSGNGALEGTEVPFLRDSSSKDEENDQNLNLSAKISVESKKLWQIVGPAIFSRVASFSMLVVTQAFAGHLGDLELAAVSIANNVILGLAYGILTGMSNSLETLCGQAFGAKRYHMLGVYMQRSWIVLFVSSVLLLPIYMFATPILKLLGQPHDIAELSGVVSIYLIPHHFSFAFLFPLQIFLQSQLKNSVTTMIIWVTLVLHVIVSWLFVYKLQLGVIGIAITFSFSWWFNAFAHLGYAIFGGCPLTWNGFSMDAFSNLWKFTKHSAASGIMLCSENWYYRILILMTGNLKNAKIAVDALSICMSINGWEMMIPMAFCAATGVRVGNELGSGNGKGAKFATKVSVITSIMIGFFFFSIIILFNDKLALMFTSSEPVLRGVGKLSVLLASTVLLNSVQPVLCGVAVGLGWQKYMAYINISCYYLIGLPLGFLMGWFFHLGVMGIWAGMIFGGTAVQTIVLTFIVITCNWDKEAENAASMLLKQYESGGNQDSQTTF